MTSVKEGLGDKRGDVLMREQTTPPPASNSGLQSASVMSGRGREARFLLLVPTVYIIFLMLPIYWLLNMSFKTTNEILGGFSIFPRNFTVASYVEILTNPVWCRPCMMRECPIDHRCMQGVGVDRVVGAVRQML